MALIICSECGKKYSDKAPACPECGCPTISNGNIKRKKVIIRKCFSLFIRTSVSIDNQPVGEIGIRANKEIELELPVGVHYIGLDTNVRHGDYFAPSAVSKSTNGKQFTIEEDDLYVVIEICAKGSFSNSSGRCVVGNILNYKSEDLENEAIEEQRRELEKGFIFDVSKSEEDYLDEIDKEEIGDSKPKGLLNNPLFKVYTGILLLLVIAFFLVFYNKKEQVRYKVGTYKSCVFKFPGDSNTSCASLKINGSTDCEFSITYSSKKRYEGGYDKVVCKVDGDDFKLEINTSSNTYRYNCKFDNYNQEEYLIDCDNDINFYYEN